MHTPSQIADLASALLRIRLEKNLRLVDVGKEANLSASWLSNLETGKKMKRDRMALGRLEKYLRERGYFPVPKKSKAA